MSEFENNAIELSLEELDQIGGGYKKPAAKAVRHVVPFPEPQNVAIENVWPAVDDGRFSVRREPGDVVEVTVDGKTLRAGEVQGPSSGTGTFTFTIEGRPFNWSRHVHITVRDYAGRDASVENGTWFWQSSFVVEGLTLLGAVAAVTAGVVAYLRHRAAAEPELPM